MVVEPISQFNEGSDVMSNKSHSRPVLFVTDIDRSVDFCVTQFGFTQNWRFDVEAKAGVAQVSRLGCELMLNSESPDKPKRTLTTQEIRHPRFDQCLVLGTHRRS